MPAVDHFKAKAPGIMAQLIRDFPVLTPTDAAAILGNLGHESGGLQTLQEINPTVAGSRGGYGWAQWTGPRRRAFEAYCKRTGKDPASDDANYAYLFLELKGIEGSEGGAIGKLVKDSRGLAEKVVTFEKAFLRAGIKHYDSRLIWAQRALEAWREKSSSGIPIPSPTPAPRPTSQTQSTGVNITAALFVIGLLAAGAVIWFVFFNR